MANYRFRVVIVCCLLGMWLFAGCSKDKLQEIPNSNTSVLTVGNSSIRLFNFTNTTADISINNIPLTNYTSGQATALGLSLFPSGVWTNTDDGSPFTIPTSLVDKQGKAHIIITPRGSTTQFSYRIIDTVLQNDPSNPKDYYVLSDGTTKVVNRSVSTPSQPDHFKIRIINLAASDDSTGMYGPVTLTYANGQPVSAATSNVMLNTASDYVELPLGAYEFKVFVNGDFTKQLAELPIRPNFYGWLQSKSYQPQQQESLFPKIRTFKAGGTYSIVITKAIVPQVYGNCCVTYTWYEPVNTYRIVTELAASTNVTYACMDAVNALRSSVLNISVDGKALGSNIGFGKSSADHGIYVYGTHRVTATDQRGNTVAEKDITMYPNDYLTAWVYLNPAGSPDIVFSSTDMTSTLYQSTYLVGNQPATDYGTNGNLRITSTDYTWQARFLNLSEDVPYMTIGHDSTNYNIIYDAGYDMLFLNNASNYQLVFDSTNFPSATVNLSRGFTAAYDPFLMFQINANQFGGGLGNGMSGYPISYYYPGTMTGSNSIIAFKSNPGPPAVVPGSYIPIRGLYWTDFIANPAMYTVPYYRPLAEPGFYSVALVGKVSDPANGQPQLIYIKHNK